MNIAQIKRFVNSGLKPLKELIGTANDSIDENTVFAPQKKNITSLGSVKTVVDSLSSVPSTLSSILSKVNNLDSQKVLGLVSCEYSRSKEYTGKGMLIVMDLSSSTLNGTVDGISISISSPSNVCLPFSQGISINLNAKRYLLLFTYR